VEQRAKMRDGILAKPYLDFADVHMVIPASITAQESNSPMRVYILLSLRVHCNIVAVRQVGDDC